jgi:hypothetical protein
MENDRLSTLLQQLPPEPARPGFTARVLARLDAPAASENRTRRRPRVLALRWALAAAGLTAALLAGGLRWQAAHPAQDPRALAARRTLAAIRAEHARLQGELETLSDRRVVYLGGNEHMDFVVDLQRVPPAPRGVATASYTQSTY